jgi:hypothetical protein
MRATIVAPAAGSTSGKPRCYPQIAWIPIRLVSTAPATGSSPAIRSFADVK